jgi:hypothetical protein
MDLVDVLRWTYARKFHLGGAAKYHEILTILFDFSSSESFTIHISPKKLIAGPEGFVYT